MVPTCLQDWATTYRAKVVTAEKEMVCPRFEYFTDKELSAHNGKWAMVDILAYDLSPHYLVVPVELYNDATTVYDDILYHQEEENESY